VKAPGFGPAWWADRILAADQIEDAIAELIAHVRHDEARACLAAVRRTVDYVDAVADLQARIKLHKRGVK
jgi:hypothetical protein